MRTLILSLGGTPDPLFESIQKMRPDTIVFIASEKTASYGKEICDLLENFKGKMDTVKVDENNLDNCFIKSLQVLKRAQGEIFVDYTGGTKNMTAGLVLASFGRGVKYCYVGGTERDKGGVGTVKEGHEKLFNYIDPSDMYFIKSFEKIEYLFNRQQFGLAIGIINDCKDNLSCEKYTHELERVFKLTKSLQLWDRMRYKESYDNLNIFMKENSTMSTSLFDTRIPEDFKRHLKMCKEKNSNNILSDIIDNAKRRAKQEEFDESVLRIYRAMEYLGQIEFEKEFDQKTDKFNIMKTDISNNNVRTEYENKKKIGVRDVYKLLGEKNVEVGRLFCDHEECFRLFLSCRNQSILAHGDKNLKKDDVKKGLELLGIIFKNICPVNPPEISFKM